LWFDRRQSDVGRHDPVNAGLYRRLEWHQLDGFQPFERMQDHRQITV